MRDKALKKLEARIAKLADSPPVWRPSVFDLSQSRDRQKFSRLLQSGAVRHAVDDFAEQLFELYAYRHPQQVYRPDFFSRAKRHLRRLEARAPLFSLGRWVFYPWLDTVVHVLPDADFQKLRTSRNRHLIARPEQLRFYNSVVGIGGLSVGNSVALSMVLQGGAKHVRLADFDRLALSNLNRIRAGVESLGLNKAYLTARQIYLLNPYAKVEVFPQGLTVENISKFFTGPPKLDIVVDELDNLAVKYLIREQAQRHGIAVVMGADNGDNAVIDVERYDKKKRVPFFHGRLGEVSYKKLSGLDKFGIGRTIARHIGAKNVTERMQASLASMGKDIVSWPQLGGAATLNGVAVAYCVRKILNRQPLEDKRALVSLDTLLDPLHNTAQGRRRRRLAVKKFKAQFGLP